LLDSRVILPYEVPYKDGKIKTRICNKFAPDKFDADWVTERFQMHGKTLIIGLLKITYVTQGIIFLIIEHYDNTL
jgi:hypothetical protein